MEQKCPVGSGLFVCQEHGGVKSAVLASVLLGTGF